MPRISWDELKAMYPDDDENELMEAAKAEGVEVPEKEEEPEDKPEEVGEKPEESQEEPELEPEEEADPKTKKGLITAKQKEREKRQAAEAELKTLREELENLRKAPKPAPQTQQSTQPAEPQSNEEAAYFDTIMGLAEKRARIAAGITKEDDMDTLHLVDPKKHTKFTLALNTIAGEIHQENINKYRVWKDNEDFIGAVKTDANFAAKYEFGQLLLDEKTRREAKTIDEAILKVNQHTATDKDRKIVEDFYKEVSEKFDEARGVKQVIPQQKPQTSKLDQLSAGTRSQQLRTGTATNMSEAEISRLLDDPDNLHMIPPAILNKYKRG
jgi:hypothetical protein